MHHDFEPIRELSIARGGFFRETAVHGICFLPGDDTLIVSFEETNSVEAGGVRMPWGKTVVEGQGWSHLGVMEKRENWYRDADLMDVFDELRDAGFFKRFRRVVFYGYSMGAYGAILFSTCAPGAEVILLGPRMTYTERDSRDMATSEIEMDASGRYDDVGDAVGKAGKVSLVYDPTHLTDSRHAASFASARTETFETPHLGHMVAKELSVMGVLKPMFVDAVEGRLDRRQFSRLYRKRRDSLRYLYRLLVRVMVRGHAGLALRVIAYVESDANGARRPRFQRYRKGLQRAERRGEKYVLEVNPFPIFDVDWGLLNGKERQKILRLIQVRAKDHTS